MKASIYRISLDIQDAYANVSLDVKRGDYGRKIHLTLMDGGIPYKISKECYAVLSAEKPDGKKIFNHCTIEGNTIIYVMTPQTVAAVGVAECEVKVYGADDQLLTSACFNLVINDTVNEEDQLISEDEVDALTHLISEATTTITEGNEATEEARAATEETRTATEEARNATEEARDTTERGNDLIDDLIKARKDLDNRFASKADDLNFDEDTSILSLVSEGKIIGNGVKVVKDFVFVQPDEPENAKIGTLWYDTDEESTPVARIGEVELLAAKWIGEDNLWSQVVTIEGVTANSQVDLTPSVEQLVIFYEKDLTLVAENENGVVTVYVIGQKPQNDYTIQVTITEVKV